MAKTFSFKTILKVGAPPCAKPLFGGFFFLKIKGMGGSNFFFFPQAPRGPPGGQKAPKIQKKKFGPWKSFFFFKKKAKEKN